MYNAKLLNKIAKCGTDVFDKDTYNVGEEVANAEAIMVRSASMHEMEFEKELLAIARAGAGVNNIPLDKCADEGIVGFNTPGARARPPVPPGAITSDNIWVIYSTVWGCSILIGSDGLRS